MADAENFFAGAQTEEDRGRTGGEAGGQFTVAELTVLSATL